MKNKSYIFNYYNNSFELKNGDFISILGNCNNEIVNFLLSKGNDIISFKELNISNNLVINEIKKYCKSISKINKYLFDFDLVDYKNNIISELNINEKIKLSILLKIIQNKNIIFLDNVLSILDYSDYKIILKEFKKIKKNTIVINITNDVKETMFGNKIALFYNNNLICFGKTLSVLNEEKLFKRLGLGLPFIVELNKYLMDYGLINKYYLSNKKLVGALWK